MNFRYIVLLILTIESSGYAFGRYTKEQLKETVQKLKKEKTPSDSSNLVALACFYPSLDNSRLANIKKIDLNHIDRSLECREAVSLVRLYNEYSASVDYATLNQYREPKIIQFIKWFPRYFHKKGQSMFEKNIKKMLKEYKSAR